MHSWFCLQLFKGVMCELGRCHQTLQPSG
jgi:hypothetical protein